MNKFKVQCKKTIQLKYMNKAFRNEVGLSKNQRNICLCHVPNEYSWLKSLRIMDSRKRTL